MFDLVEPIFKSNISTDCVTPLFFFVRTYGKSTAKVMAGVVWGNTGFKMLVSSLEKFYLSTQRGPICGITRIPFYVGNSV